MRPDPTQSIDRRAVTLWRIHATIRTAVFAGLALVGFGPMALALPGPAWLGLSLLAGALVLVAIYGLLTIFVFPVLRWRLWRYHVDQHELDMQRGLFVVRRTLVPLVRVQHVDTTQGPISRYLQLSSVTVSTAAGTHEIPALSDSVAQGLRDRISALAREARDSL